MKSNNKIYIAGHTGLVGSSIVRNLKSKNFNNLLTISHSELDLTNQSKVSDFFEKEMPDYVIIAAAKVGGIAANNIYKADFIYENLEIQNNLIHNAFLNGIKNIIFLGSSCVYPRNCKQPIKEEYLLNGSLEKTNEPYAIAKIAGIKLCESYNFQYNTNYKCLMPCNIYGPKDNYDPKTSHFFPALISKIITAKKNNKDKIVIWGSGKVKRELMYVDDLADACIFFLEKKTKESLINVGTGHEMSISDYAKFILNELNFKCKITLDKKKPDGTKRKVIDSKLALKYGWKPKISLQKGLKITIKEYLSNSSK